MRRVGDEAKAAAFSATLCAGAMIAHQVAAKAARDAFFLTSFDVTQLPRMVVVSAVASVLVVLASARAMTVLTPGRVVPRAFVASAVLLLGEWALMIRAPAEATVLFYLHTIVFGSVLTSGFWSMVNERFDPHTAKQLVGRIASGGTAGALVGGLCAERIGANVSLAISFPFLAVLHLFCAWIVRDLRSERRSRTARKTPEVGSGVAILFGSSYLKSMALLVGLGTAAAALLDYVLKAEARAAFATGGELVRFFAALYAGIGLISFVTQTVLSARTLEKLGVGKTVALLPLMTSAGSIFSMLVPGLASIALSRGGESMLRTSIYRSGYELLYTPVAPAEKRATKSIIDVLCDRFGDMLGGALVAALLAVVSPEGVRPWLLAGALILSLAALLVSLRLQRGYVGALEQSLVQLGSGLAPATVASPRAVAVDRVVQFTEHMLFDREQGVFLAPDPENMLTGTGLSMELSPGRSIAVPGSSLLLDVDDRAAHLDSGDPTKIRYALLQGELTHALVPRAIRLLALNDILADALAALRRVADREVDTLVAALLDPDQDFAVRRRLPRVLTACTAPRAVKGLTSGLFDRRFEVRFQCGRALAKLRSDRIDRERVLAAVEREVAVDRGVWENHRLLDAITPDDDSGFADALLEDRANRSMEHVFRVLSLVYSPEPLRVAYKGLFTEDETLRGTALEYLDSVLPDPIKSKLFPFLGAEEWRTTRSRDEILGDLMRSSTSIMTKLAELEEASGEGS